MNDVERRKYVSNISDNDAWKQRVKKMSDNQVFAIYMREINKKNSQGDKK